MCIIINKPAGVTLSDEIIGNCFDSNPDGAGFAFADNGTVVISKGYFELGDLLNALETVMDRHLVIHFRIATHGTVNEFNCHPWSVVTESGRQFAVAHNGVLSWRSTKEESDTCCYVNDVIAPALGDDPDFLFKTHGFGLIERDIGSGNKMVALRDDGKFVIINEDAGITDMGCWFSNHSYKPLGRPMMRMSYTDFDLDDGWTRSKDGRWSRKPAKPDWPARADGEADYDLEEYDPSADFDVAQVFKIDSAAMSICDTLGIDTDLCEPNEILGRLIDRLRDMELFDESDSDKNVCEALLHDSATIEKLVVEFV
jgi:predicted glutamine amidotransferase